MKEPIWILAHVVLAAHDAQIAEHGGPSGIRDQNLLQSALSHAQNLFAYNENITLAELAAAYAERIAKNHPFIDGNKRSAYVSMALFLKLNGFDLVATKEEKVRKMVELASNQISVKKLVNWLEKNIKPSKRAKSH